MKTSQTLAFAVLAVALIAAAGCVVTSVYPYYTAKDVVLDPALVGTWTETGETNAQKNWQFARGGGQDYTLIVQDEDEKTEFTAHLFKLKERRFIDALPAKRDDDFIPPHYLLQIARLEDSTLEMSIMSYKWLEELVEKNPKAIRHTWIEREPGKREGGKLVLTADTAELQKFVLKHAADTNAFPEAFKMTRR